MGGSFDDLRALTLLLLAFAIALLATPLRTVWAHPGAPWWTPFAVWSLLILLALLIARRWGRSDE